MQNLIENKKFGLWRDFEHASREHAHFEHAHFEHASRAA